MSLSYPVFCSATRFVLFLIDEFAYSGFVTYLSLSRGITLTEFLYTTDPSRYVSDAFDFSDTYEGEVFWRTLSDEWSNILSKLSFCS